MEAGAVQSRRVRAILNGNNVYESKERKDAHARRADERAAQSAAGCLRAESEHGAIWHRGMFGTPVRAPGRVSVRLLLPTGCRGSGLPRW